MSCRSLIGNSITLIPANAFTSLTQLQTLFDISLSPLHECSLFADNPLTIMASAAFGPAFDGIFRFFA